ncbi:complex I subunit 4 family protein [Caldinitratiruptor microaerophilus]|uniref:NADH:ubiquinone oxidoreductase subunit M n=1 Tax=Caldinitratiruptor microaerophilus TaxID=671077 RepID=A0AA35CPC2_9FIRM|nr:NADH-quinone oxidoreductase subunit M [Caldinitratiruptor microaerophilus]BDG61225.1 NADH:ubiquinone oxidoreductase subunit M [Caldinitratiruptor microaerophilus]
MGALTIIVFFPLLAALVTLLVPREQDKAIKGIALVGTLVPLALAISLIPRFQLGTDAIQFEEIYRWIPSLGIQYHLGVDGWGLTMLVLSALLFPLAVIASFGYIEHRVKDYFVLLLILETGVNGVFAALDFVLFYVFWEVVLLPMYFLIGIWGGPRREYAAIKFFLYTFIASVIMLVGTIALYLNVPEKTFDLLRLAEQTRNLPVSGLTVFAFFALLVGFMVKVPAFPFHTWLPDAHVEAPTPISMLLAGILLKMGTYAMVRISHPFLPQVAVRYTTLLAVIGIVGIVYGALAAMAQKDFKKMVAYSSVAHMGFFILGLAAGTPEALAGGYYETIAHGLISPLFFFVVGMYYERTHTRELARLSGMYLTVPAVSFVAAFTAFANLGLPGLAGFIAEFYTLTGSFKTFGLWVLAAGAGMVIIAAFHLIMMRQVLMGEKKYESLPDITLKERIVFAPLAVLIVLLGVYPTPIFRVLDPVIQSLVRLLGGA